MKQDAIDGWSGDATEDLLHSLIDASPDFICLKDGEGRWRIANRTALELFGLDAGQYLGKSDIELADIVHPNLRGYFQQCPLTDAEVWEQASTSRCERTLSLPNGGERVFDVIKIPLFHKDGSRRALIMLGRDISERKTVERDFASRSAILDALISCDWLLHTSDSWAAVTPAVLELLGVAPGYDRVSLYKNEDTAGRPRVADCLFRWVAPARQGAFPPCEVIDYKSSSCSRWLTALGQGRPIFGQLKEFAAEEQEFLQRFGTQSLILVPVFAGDKWWGALGVERCSDSGDIPPQELGAMMAAGRSFGVAMQHEIASERLQQAMVAFDCAAEGIMVTDEQARIIAINQSFTDITGYSEEEVLNKTPKLLFSGRHDESFYREIQERVESDGRWQGEIWNRRKNGEIFPQWMTINVVRGADGRVLKQVAVFSDISETKRAQERLHALVNHDPLTGLPNRRLLNELVDHALKRAERDGKMVAVLFIDLDRFKAVNDTLGHQVGDKLLLEVARRLTQAIRESDTVARLGGDEFLIMMDGMNGREEAALVAKKVLLSLQAEFNVDGRELYIGASIGISVFPSDAPVADELIKMADIAMYQVKNSGKNNYCYYSAELSQSAVERFTMDVELRRALERGQFALYYQPRISLQSGRVIGAEALVRWHHPELGLVSPEKFIPLAEETGLIVQLGEWVLHEAAEQGMNWLRQGLSVESISVNVSGVQIQRSNLADTVYGIMLETECEQGLLELEITESTVMHNTQHVSSVCDQIRQLGLLLAIDDFGTGYSSLSHLKRLPLDKLKVDKSFVRDLPHDEEDAVITKAICALGHSLGLTVVAEGVETVEQHEFLRAIGCDEAQGYYYGEPDRAEVLARRLREQLTAVNK